jgi:hypothetical protein
VVFCLEGENDDIPWGGRDRMRRKIKGSAATDGLQNHG